MLFPQDCASMASCLVAGWMQPRAMMARRYLTSFMHCSKSVKPCPCLPWEFRASACACTHSTKIYIRGPGSTGGAPGHPESNLILHTALQVWYQPTSKKQEWHVFNERCSLQPLASQLLSSTYQSTGLRVPVLFIGDSTD